MAFIEKICSGNLAFNFKMVARFVTGVCKINWFVNFYCNFRFDYLLQCVSVLFLYLIPVMCQLVPRGLHSDYFTVLEDVQRVELYRC